MMKKIIDIIDYVFYRTYAFIKKCSFIKIDGASDIFCLIFFLMPLLLIIVPVCRIFGMSVHRYSVTWILLMAIMYFLSLPITKRYKDTDRLRNLEIRWKNENPRNRKIKGWIIVSLVFNNVVLIPILLCLLVHYAII